MSHSPAFRKGLSSIIQGEILVPPIRAYMASPDFRGFDLKIRGLGSLAPDGKFHPSSHPLAPEMVLYLWVVAPDLLLREPLDPSALLSMTVGSIWHGIMARILTDLGLLVQDEVRLTDPEANTDGKTDGLLHTGELYELKTMSERVIRYIKTPDDFIDRYPGYMAQAQEYLRMADREAMRVLIMSLTFPYEMREFVIHRDRNIGNATRAKYLRVLQAVADQRPPMCDGCWTKKGSDCPARSYCEHRAKGAA